MWSCGVIILGVIILGLIPINGAKYQHSQSRQYVRDFPSLMEKSYTMVDTNGPADLLAQCKNRSKRNPTGSITVLPSSSSNIISSSEVQNQCGTSTTCNLQDDLTLEMDAPLILHSLVVKNGGKVLWTDATHPPNQDIWLCAGYVAIETRGSFELNIQDERKRAWIYIMNNSAFHPTLKSRSFGAVGEEGESNTIIDIQGKDLKRTWSLLQQPLLAGYREIKLLHNPLEMGWKVGDRIAIAPTDDKAKSEGQSFTISGIESDGKLLLDDLSSSRHDANAYLSPSSGEAIFQSAEVINLSRNVVITGDDFEEIPCDPSLPETILGEETSVEGCRCASIRESCTVGLHTVHMFGGTSRIENTRVEKCGQRGIEGKYCLHFHQLKECPNCIFRNNAIETSQQRGIIVHGTHLSTSETNVLYNVRGANIYIEDGNEVGNTISYNVAICPWKYNEGGCSVPGTSNSQSDTSINQSGLYAVTPTNNLIGNRMVNHFNGMFIEVNGIGRGTAYDKVCTHFTPVGRIEGNVFHSNGRFGTYFLSNNYPLLATGQSVSGNGYTESCDAFTATGEDNGFSTALRNNFDYGNAFVGNYNAGDIQFSHHTSIDNNNLIYWKETKIFADGCSAHIRDSFFKGGTMGLPDSLGSFIIENTVIQDAIMEANHHCTVGITGFLCMPHYILHNVTFSDNPGKWVTFNRENNRNNGGIFSLSPEDAALNDGTSDGNYFLPAGYTSLVSTRFSYLLLTGKCDSSIDLNLGIRYENGILCKRPLQVLKIFTKDLPSGSKLKVEISLSASSTSITSFSVPLQKTSDRKQGFVLAIIPGYDFRYNLKLDNGQGDIPDDWIIDFGDMAQSNRWGADEARIEVQGRNCGNIIKSDHDRRFVAANSEDLLDDLSWGHGACTSFPQMPMITCTLDSEEDKLQPLECSGLCGTNECGDKEYCDCYLQRCMCKPGYFGSNCELDSCASSRCVHGACAAKLLGPSSLLPEMPCVCTDGWVGDSCDINLCKNVNCGDHGVCKAISESEAICECEAGWNGALCDITCNNSCEGLYPYGCATNLDGKKNYICGPSKNQCYYSSTVEDTGPSGWCVFKSTVPTPIPPTIPPMQPPTVSSPVIQPTSSPIMQPTKSPMIQPTTGPENPTYCGCHNCTTEKWNTYAGDHTCGARIQWLQRNKPNEYPFREDACRKVSSEFPTICGPNCDPDQCDQFGLPTESPSKLRTNAPSRKPSMPPTHPSKMPTPSPLNDEDQFCGCESCTQEVLDFSAGEYACGGRMRYLRNDLGYSEEEACIQIAAVEFPNECGLCNPIQCNQEIIEDPDPSDLIWADEFNGPNGSAPDPLKWGYDIGGNGWGNGEAQHYTDRRDNSYVSNGFLHVRAAKENYAGSGYTSARLITKNKGDWKYGRFRARARLQQCTATGTWPAIWMLPTEWAYGNWPRSGEIDIMEHVGYDTGKVHGTVHTSAFNHIIGTQRGGSTVIDVRQWHIYEVIWNEGKVDFIVDGIKYYEFLNTEGGSFREWPFDERFHLILNVAVGGSWGGSQGIDSAAFEGNGQIMDVDWVRVYRNAASAPSLPTTALPTISPTKYPTSIPTQFPTGSLTSAPTFPPTPVPTNNPTTFPTQAPTKLPTLLPTLIPTKVPSSPPTKLPTNPPTNPPTPTPTSIPTTNPTKITTFEPTKLPSLSPSDVSLHCSCPDCTYNVWNSYANQYTCGSRILWLQQTHPEIYPTEETACQHVAEEFPVVCGSCNPNECIPQRCGCVSCTNEVWSTIAEGHSCGSRIEWLQENIPEEYPTEQDACRKVAEEYPNMCGPKCDPDSCNDWWLL